MNRPNGAKRERAPPTCANSSATAGGESETRASPGLQRLTIGLKIYILRLMQISESVGEAVASLGTAPHQALLHAFNSLWALPPTPVRESCMDSLIVLIDEFEHGSSGLV